MRHGPVPVEKASPSKKAIGIRSQTTQVLHVRILQTLSFYFVPFCVAKEFGYAKTRL